MGSGVADGETFDALARGATQRGTLHAGMRYEVLNFGVAGYSLLQQLRMLDDRVCKFHPDVVVLTDGRRATVRSIRHVTSALAHGTITTYPELAEIVQRAGGRGLSGQRFAGADHAAEKRSHRPSASRHEMPERESCAGSPRCGRVDRLANAPCGRMARAHGADSGVRRWYVSRSTR